MTATPNHALQRTAPRVTLAAADHPATFAQPAPAALPQPARRAPQSLSLGRSATSARMTLKAALIYLLLLVPSLLLAAVAWSVGVSGHLYYCWDSVPLFDFIPPFVHADPPSSSVRDYYIAAPWIVYATWALLLVGSLSIPFVITRRVTSGTHALRT